MIWHIVCSTCQRNTMYGRNRHITGKSDQIIYDINNECVLRDRFTRGVLAQENRDVLYEIRNWLSR